MDIIMKRSITDKISSGNSSAKLLRAKNYKLNKMKDNQNGKELNTTS